MVGRDMEISAIIKIICKIYEEKIPFHNLLGISVGPLNEEHPVSIKLEMREELIGNYALQILHGGAISSILDMIGGLTATVGILKEMSTLDPVKIEKKITRLGTIDLRVDYLRPGKGEYFLATGSLMRIGKKVAVTRMELHNEQDLLIAVGTGTYLVG